MLDLISVPLKLPGHLALGTTWIRDATVCPLKRSLQFYLPDLGVMGEVLSGVPSKFHVLHYFHSQLESLCELV